MLYSKIMRFPIAGPSVGLLCNFSREFRRELNTVPSRRFTASQGHCSDSDSKISSPEEILHPLDKDVPVPKTQMEDTKEAFKGYRSKTQKAFDDLGKKIDSRFNRMMFIVLGAIILQGGFDVWRDGRKGSRK